MLRHIYCVQKTSIKLYFDTRLSWFLDYCNSVLHQINTTVTKLIGQLTGGLQLCNYDITVNTPLPEENKLLKAVHL